ncbi:hypothetical protein [Paraburkholderia sp. BL21I4N1]|uniref:DUF7940 domain-containing protein n=1 Tax=Paraburkholderia sp. BL21I4N1 TaxID=1938801 RepID=UPI000CFCA276|nr:hypothetical protein [Paraburkholderia sp. BL21I4N1]PQV51873.1 hypothetical protein B0G83_10482 [Paraburkholderia sp. BL21I4N1]
MKHILIEDWRKAWKYASVQLAALLAMLYSVIPLAADQWPNVMPSFIFWFPAHGQQWAPVIGSVLFIVARVVQRPHREQP